MLPEFPGQNPDEEDPLAMPNVVPETTSLTKDAPGGGASTSTPAPSPAPAPSPVASAPMVNAMGASLPEEVHTRHHQGSSSGGSHTIASPDSVETLQKLKTAQAVGLEAARAESNAKLDLQAIENQHAQQLANQMEAQAKERAILKARHEEMVAAKMAEAEKRRAQMEKDSKITDYFEDRGGAPARVLSAFITGLSNYSHWANGGEGWGPATIQLEKEIAQDRASKIRTFENSKEFYEIARKDADAAERMKSERLHEIDEQHLIAGNVLKAKLAATAKSLGTPVAKAAADKEIAGIDAAQQKLLLNEQQHYDKQTTWQSGRDDTTDTKNENKAGGGPPTRGPTNLLVPDLAGRPAGNAPNQETADKLRELQKETHAFKRSGDKLIGLIQKYPGAFDSMDPNVKRQFRDASQEYIGHLTKARMTGTLQGKEFERYDEVVKPGYIESLMGTADSTNVLRSAIADAGHNYEASLDANFIPRRGAWPKAPEANDNATKPAAPAAQPTSTAKPVGKGQTLTSTAGGGGGEDKAARVAKITTLQRFLASPEAQSNPDKAARARQAIRALGAAN